MQVKDLKAKMAVDEITLEIVSKGEVRKFANERSSGKICNCAAKDDTGEISLTLWNDDVDKVEEGSKVKIEKGWVSEYNGNLQVSAGKFGILTIL
ncbi:MAG: hypothetical protein COT15_02845 [Candidatus Diapherotrites archaeon CG08_land_8_20_14_0_20_34_12]|nr:MAG: hypothetical protein COT15_02845 [Candidatus Diapherotrites archaeon CG08_land_8_20_14_0_20_34_12]